MEGREGQVIVFDNGSHQIKAGFSGEDLPRVIFPSLIGRVRQQTFMSGVGMGVKSAYVGAEAWAKKGILNLRKPIVGGLITNMDDMEQIWSHNFYQGLSVAPEEHPVLMSEKPWNSNKMRESCVQSMFEYFLSPALYLASESSLALHASGKETGLVVSTGYNVCAAEPVYEGHAIRHATKCVEVGGLDIENYLEKVLNEKGLPNTDERGIIHGIMEKLCYTARDCEAELFEEKPYELPDGKIITVGKECFRSCETLFQRPANGVESLPEGICNAILGSPADELSYDLDSPSDSSLLSLLPNELLTSIRKTLPVPVKVQTGLCKNIVVQGGPSMLPGFSDRLLKELKSLLPVPFAEVVQIDSPPNRKHSVWVGGSTLASLPTFKDMWISREEYDENGPILAHKCLT